MDSARSAWASTHLLDSETFCAAGRCVFCGTAGGDHTVQLFLHLQGEQALDEANIEQSAAELQRPPAAAAIFANGTVERFERPLVAPLPARDPAVRRLDIAAAEEVVSDLKRLLGALQHGGRFAHPAFLKR